MNLIDLGIVVLLVLAAVHGVSRGAAIQVMSFGGLWIGLTLGAALAPTASEVVESPAGKALLSLVAVFGLAALVSAIGRQVGVRAWSFLHKVKLGVADSVLGGAIACVATLAAVWLLALTLSAGPSQAVSAAVQESAIARTLVARLPPAPSVFARIQQLVDASGFPKVFEGFEPTPAPPVALPNDPSVRAAVDAAGASTVKIVGLGCGGVQEGSGFVAAPGLVVTNAHVVAGIRRPTVEDRRGRHVATPVLFDSKLDMAVLRTSNLAGPPLPIVRREVPRGTGGAVLGYPAGGPFRAGAAAVLREFNAVGRDIYGESLTERNVYQLQASVRPGNSGGPFVRPNGEVAGLIFASSTTESNVGYAITSTEVAPRVDQARAQRGAVDTGPCTR